MLETDLPRYVEMLSAVERKFLAEAAHGDGRVAPDVFAAKYGVRCPTPGYFYRQGEASLIHLLLARDDYSADLRIPESFVEPLRALLPKPADPQVATVAELPREIEAGRWDHQRELRHGPLLRQRADRAWPKSGAS